MEPIDVPISNSIDLKTSYIFPLAVRLTGIFLIVVGVAVIAMSFLLTAALVIAGLFVATSHYRIEVDFDRTTYCDYSWIFGFTVVSERGRFERIQYIFINKNKVSETARARVASTTFTRYDYNGYLKFSEKQKIHLGSDSSKNFIVRRMQIFAAKMNCQLHDYSDD